MLLVLVVEDEPLLRMVAADLVREAGFEPVEAADADIAMRMLETRNDIGIIFTDIDMPTGSMNGLRLAAAVRDRWPPIKIIITSGHYRARAEELPEGSLFFLKPYPHGQVIGAMRNFARAA